MKELIAQMEQRVKAEKMIEDKMYAYSRADALELDILSAIWSDLEEAKANDDCIREAKYGLDAVRVIFGDVFAINLEVSLSKRAEKWQDKQF